MCVLHGSDMFSMFMLKLTQCSCSVLVLNHTVMCVAWLRRVSGIMLARAIVCVMVWTCSCFNHKGMFVAWFRHISDAFVNHAVRIVAQFTHCT